jgi:cell division septation protein DedD
MSKLSLPFRALLLGIAGLSSAAGAQAADTTAKTPTAIAAPGDSIFLRARQLVLEGNGSVGRALVDSAVRATEGTPEYATALYWRGALASAAADAERDYRRVIVDYPFSTHSGDALLALAQLEMARGDRGPAIDHLQRFLLQRPNDPERIRAGIWLGRMLLDENQPARGCAVLLRTRASLGDTAVEIRNQVDYYTARCAGVDTTTPRVPIGAQSVKPQPASDTLRRRSAPRPTAPDTVRRRSGQPASHVDSTDTKNGAKRFTVQVAAYDTRAAAEQLADRLGTRGIVARVVNVGRAPYRVRIGRYATDQEATTAARELKKKGIEGFVTTTDNEAAAAPPRQ